MFELRRRTACQNLFKLFKKGLVPLKGVAEVVLPTYIQQEIASPAEFKMESAAEIQWRTSCLSYTIIENTCLQ